MAREMKDSGISWIGEIPQTWKRTKLFNILRSPISDGPHETPMLVEKGIPFISIDSLGPSESINFSCCKKFISEVDYLRYRQKAKIEKGDILFSKAATIGKTAIVGDEIFMVWSPLAIIKADSRLVDNKYIYHVLNCAYFIKHISLLGSLNTQINVGMREIEAAIVPLPGRIEQHLISDFLDKKCAETDAVLEKTRSSIEEYKRLKQAIIAQAVTKGVRGDRPMKESGIEWVRELPAEWEVTPSRYLFANSDERKRPDDELLTASQKHGIISQRQYMERENTGIVLANKGIENWKHVEPYDFIISLRSFQGGLEMSETVGCTTWHYIVLKPLKPIYSFYYKWLFKSELYIKALQRTCNFIRDGQDLRYSNFVQVPLFIPPMDEQEAIAEYLNDRCAKIDDLIKKKEELVAYLSDYRKNLIYEYVTGKKEVPTRKGQQVKEIIVYPYFPAVFKASSPRFAQAILMSKVLDECRTKMGRVKLEKMMFVLENSIGFDFDTEYVREAAGPLDKSIYTCEKIISKKNKWFTISTSQYGVSYKPTKDVVEYQKYYDQYFSDYEDSISRVIEIFKNFDADQAEVIATLYGAWNDFIIDKRSYTDDDIVDEVLNRWHPKKRRFPRDMWLRAIQRMRELNIVPHGYGRHTVIKEAKAHANN